MPCGFAINRIRASARSRTRILARGMAPLRGAEVLDQRHRRCEVGGDGDLQPSALVGNQSIGLQQNLLAIPMRHHGRNAVAPKSGSYRDAGSQSGQNDVACHAGGQFPELTPDGRLFKLTGYTIGKRGIPISAMVVFSPSKVRFTVGAAWPGPPAGPARPASAPRSPARGQPAKVRRRKSRPSQPHHRTDCLAGHWQRSCSSPR